MINHRSMKDGIVKFNESTLHNQLYRVVLFTAILYAAANLGKTSVKLWHAASLPRQERGVNLRIGRGKTSVNG